MLLWVVILLTKLSLTIFIQLLPSYLKFVVILLYSLGFDISRPIFNDFFQSFSGTLITTNEQIDEQLCMSAKCCRMTNAADCALHDMIVGENTMVMPAGGTRCMYSFLGSYAFQVRRGDSDKLLIFMQGGGVCSSQFNTATAGCKLTLNVAGPIREPAFQSYTMVSVLYCSGDLHIGNVTRSYTDPMGEPIEQRGLLNTQAVLDWVVHQQQHSDALDSQLSSLLLMGSSAGAVGVQFWSRQMLNTLKWKSAAVVVDSYLAVPNTAHLDRYILPDFGACDSGFLSEGLSQRCRDGLVQLQDCVLEMASSFPHVPYAFIHSKSDSTQMQYFAPGNDDRTKFEFYVAASEVLATYAQQLSNVAFYVVDGAQHVFLTQPVFQTANIYGPTGGAIIEDSTDSDTAIKSLVNYSNEMNSRRSSDHGSVNSNNNRTESLSKTVGAPLSSSLSSSFSDHRFLRQQQTQRRPAVKKLHQWVAQLPLQQGQLLKSACDGTLVTEAPKFVNGDLDFCFKVVATKTYHQV